MNEAEPRPQGRSIGKRGAKTDADQEKDSGRDERGASQPRQTGQHWRNRDEEDGDRRGLHRPGHGEEGGLIRRQGQ